MRVAGVILAGGKGSRFKPYSELLAKPMLPLNDKGRPLIDYIVRWLVRHGLRDLVVLVGHLSEQVRGYLGDGSRYGARIRYSEDDETYSNTGGALLKAYVNGLLDYDAVLVWYGDIIAEVNPSEVLETHEAKHADATVVVADRYQLPVGVAQLTPDHRITKLEEKPWIPIHATIGILALNPQILDQARELGTRFDIMAHLIPWMISQGKNVIAYTYKGPWHDIGSLERYVKLDKNLFSNFLSTIEDGTPKRNKQ